MKLRPATAGDAQAIADLVNYWFRKTGDVLPRSEESVESSLGDWVVVDNDGQVISCGALVKLDDDLIEVRSLAVRPDYQGHGLGRQIVHQLIEDAQALGNPTIFTLTKSVGFFEKMGFVVTETHNFPSKVWQDCIHCPKFFACDEVAMIYIGGDVVDQAQQWLPANIALTT